MQKQLKIIPVKLCEKLPLGITIFEKDGFCYMASNISCKYCGKKDRDYYSCDKKTYISNLEFSEP